MCVILIYTGCTDSSIMIHSDSVLIEAMTDVEILTTFYFSVNILDVAPKN